MKPRHAAALAFVGWYLMLPPPRFDATPQNLPIPGEANTDAPFKFWDAEGSFDSASDCEAAKQKGIDFHRWIDAKERREHPDWLTEQHQRADEEKMDREYKVPQGYHRALRNFGLLSAALAQCVASDDPRLKNRP